MTLTADEQLLLEALSALTVLVGELDFGGHMKVLRRRQDADDVARLNMALLHARAVVERLKRDARSVAA